MIQVRDNLLFFCLYISLQFLPILIVYRLPVRMSRADSFPLFLNVPAIEREFFCFVDICWPTSHYLFDSRLFTI